MSQMFEEMQFTEEQQSESADQANGQINDKANDQINDRAGDMIVSADEFGALEERVLRAVRLVKQERQARTAAEGVAAEAEARAERAESELREKEPVLSALETENKTLKAERDHVRERVERLLAQLDALEL